jgi:hypothetical protein
MAQLVINTPPLDPNLYTGPYRLLSGPVRTGDVTADLDYGLNGQVEFASWLYVGAAGNISYVKWDGTTQVLNNVSAGIWHNIYSIRINSVGTAATGLVWGS